MKTILLLLLSVCIANAKLGDAEWMKENRAAWAVIRVEFAEWGVPECIKIVREWDKAALKGNWEIYLDPWKPLYFLRWENEQRIAAAAEAEAARRRSAALAVRQENERRLNAELLATRNSNRNDAYELEKLREDVQRIEQERNMEKLHRFMRTGRK